MAALVRIPADRLADNLQGITPPSPEIPVAAKKRVYDLAKEFGMTGQDLAAKLRDLGFSGVKSHMTALDEFQVLEIRGRLEAYGVVGESHGDGPGTMGGLKIKRKKKKTIDEEVAAEEPPVERKPAKPAPLPEEVDAETTPVEAAPPVDHPAGIKTPEPPVPAAPTAASTTVPTTAPIAAPHSDGSPVEEAPPAAAAPPAPAAPADEEPNVETTVAAAAPEVGSAPAADAPPADPAAPEPTADSPTAAPAAEVPGDTAAVEAATAAAEVDGGELAPVTEGSPPVETGSPVEAGAVADAGTVAPAAEPAAAPAAEAGAKTTAKAPAKGADLVRPSAKRRAGKVVGFIDPSQFAQQPVRRAQSRRLRSADDTVPDVKPTFGRDRHVGQVRGDQTRGSLTAQQLREREAGRFLRRRRVQGGGDARRGGRGGRPRTMSTGSPHSGGTVQIDAPITIKKLANTLAVKENAVLRVAMQQIGFGININSLLDEDAATLLADEFDVVLEITEEVAAEETLLRALSEKREAVDDADLVDRPPTVAFLGHVDHGKTTLIDTIRQSRITHGESGGITQHIGAYQVTTKLGHTITIVDTPGHAAFTAMRARGARAVDVVVLVVAADDGVKPQTEEAYNHAKAAGTPVVVALNKMDKAEANPDRVMNELAALGLTTEDWGGETAMLRVSALKGEGIEELLERVFLESEVLELKSHPSGPAQGIVLEAEIQQGKGKVAHLLVKDGSLNRGDIILAGEGYGKVRSIHDDHGKQINEAGPSMPVEVTGLNELPTVGDAFHVVDSLDVAKEVAEDRAHQNRLISQLEHRRTLHTDIFEAVEAQEKTSINLIIKADVQGSVEVLKQQIADLVHDEMTVRLLHSGVGSVLESDVDLAATSNARILAFHTSATNKVRQSADRQGVDIKVYRVIYELLDDVRRLMEGELAPEIREEVLGHVEIRRVFKSSKFGNIAGCYVLDGKVTRSAKARLLRDGQVVYEGAIGSLRREADDTKEVREGFECGVLLKDYNDLREQDVIEAFKIVEIKRTL